MSGCSQYSLVPTPNFRSSFESTIKTYYSTDSKNKQAFIDLVGSYLDLLQANPRRIQEARSESWPPGRKVAKSGLEFRKLRFLMPGLTKSAQRGRLMYLIHDGSCRVFLIWTYTHADFSSRPPDADLRPLLAACRETALRDLAESPLELSTRRPPGKLVVTVTITPVEGKK